MNKILIVEDEAAISNLIKENLCDAGYVCTCAFDGMEAANQIDLGSFDLILLDIMLPSPLKLPNCWQGWRPCCGGMEKHSILPLHF